jgi:chromosome segregation ATPase
MPPLSISSALSRASLKSRQTKHRKEIPEIHPSEIHELKMRIGQTTTKTRRLRSQLNRLNDRILAQTNAIIRTREQQSEVSAVAGSHDNTIAQLGRSIKIAQNALAVLKEDLTKTINDDRTFVIKELEEEVKLAYAENVRLNARSREAEREVQIAEQQLQDAAHRAAPVKLNILRQQIRDLHNTNAELRDKAVAYRAKKRRLDIEGLILEHIQKKVPTDETVEEAEKRTKELEEQIAGKRAELVAGEDAFLNKVAELQECIERQRFVITMHLVPPDDDVEQETPRSDEETDDTEGSGQVCDECES